MQPEARPVIGVGACLMGRPVRYNGVGKRRNMHLDAFSEHFDMRLHCPEVAIGLGVPREPIRLVGEPESPRLMDSNTQTEDFTDAIADQAKQFLEHNPEAVGYIFVKGSPSCGLERVKRYDTQGNSVAADTRGVFAAALINQNAILPVEEDGRLHDTPLRENFITRIYAYREWRQLTSDSFSYHDLLQFWSRYKYLTMAHHVPSYRALGKLLADGSKRPLDEVAGEFVAIFMEGLSHCATRGKRTNVLQHLRGYLKKLLSSEDKKEVDRLIEQYRNGYVPLLAPLTLLRHHFKQHDIPYIDQQVFIQPYPDALKVHCAI